MHREKEPEVPHRPPSLDSLTTSPKPIGNSLVIIKVRIGSNGLTKQLKQ